jgi:hypothetical protein
MLPGQLLDYACLSNVVHSLPLDPNTIVEYIPTFCQGLNLRRFACPCGAEFPSFEFLGFTARVRTSSEAGLPSHTLGGVRLRSLGSIGRVTLCAALFLVFVSWVTV